MTAWSSIKPNQLLPSSLVQAVASASAAITAILGEATDGFSIPSLPSVASLPDTASIVVNTILDTIAGILKGGHVHTLVIPIVKNIPAQAQAGLPPTLQDLQYALDVVLGPENILASAQDSYTEMVTKSGGNAGFFTAFAESIMDPLDPNRPQYDEQKDAVAMAVLMVGATRFAKIVPAASTLDVLFSPTADNSLTARTVPVPQNVLAKAVGAAVKPGVGIRLDWDKPSTKFSSPFFPQISTVVSRYAIIRSTDPKAQNARTVLDFFQTQALSVGLTQGSATVVAMGSGRNSAYLDTSTKLDPAVPLYYCVAWECEITEAGVTTKLPFDRVSNVVKADIKAPAPPQTGKAPNWTASRNAIDAIPAVAGVADRMVAETRVLLKPGGTSTSRLKDAMQLSVDASNRLSKRATSMVDDVKRYAAALARPIPSMYVTQMSSATGGTAFLLAELSKRLGDTSDPSRPPFDNGEYVCGVCFVAGASRLADLASVLSFFSAVFGPASSANPLMGLLAAIDTSVTQAEAVAFGPDMRPLAAETTTTFDTTGQPTTTSIDPVTGKPQAPARPTIANDGTAVSTNSINNPDAGATNITPLSELC